MSGSLSSSPNDIDDVISSVRRLVSIDARPRPVTRDLGADRLLLTPALRIVPGAAPDVEPALTAKAPVEEVASAPVVEAVAVEAILAEAPVDAVALAAPEPEPEPEVQAVVPAPDDMIAETDPPEAAVDQPAPEVQQAAPDRQPLQLVDDEWEDEIWAEPDTSLAELALGAEEAELVLPGAVADSDAVPDLVEAEAPSSPRLGDLDHDAPWAQVDGDWADDLPDPVVPFESLRARVAAEAPLAEADPLRAETVELTDPDGNPLTILDEAALQEIVRQLIREELQGSLGERITRNVRKLVRAEINRALTARSLD